MLNSLEIKNFRLLENFQVKKLGQVNLIVGKNNSGKSSVLEALRIYAGNANKALLIKIAKSHNEKYLLKEDDYLFNTALPFDDLFTGRYFPSPLANEKFYMDQVGISIGETNDKINTLMITHGFLIREKISFEKLEINEKQTNVNAKKSIESIGLMGSIEETISFKKPKDNKEYENIIIIIKKINHIFLNFLLKKIRVQGS